MLSYEQPLLTNSRIREAFPPAKFTGFLKFSGSLLADVDHSSGSGVPMLALIALRELIRPVILRAHRQASLNIKLLSQVLRD